MLANNAQTLPGGFLFFFFFIVTKSELLAYWKNKKKKTSLYDLRKKMVRANFLAQEALNNHPVVWVMSANALLNEYTTDHFSHKIWNRSTICFSVSITVDERRSYERERMQERKKRLKKTSHF